MEKQNQPDIRAKAIACRADSLMGWQFNATADNKMWSDSLHAVSVNSFCRRGKYPTTSPELLGSGVSNDSIDVEIHFLRQFFLDASDLAKDFVCRWWLLRDNGHDYQSPINSSGVHKTGISRPAAATISDNSLMIEALAMCLQFHVSRISTAWTDETAI